MTIVTCMYMQLLCVTYDRVRDIEKTCRVHETYINDNNRDLDSFCFVTYALVRDTEITLRVRDAYVWIMTIVTRRGSFLL